MTCLVSCVISQASVFDQTTYSGTMRWDWRSPNWWLMAGHYLFWGRRYTWWNVDMKYCYDLQLRLIEKDMSVGKDGELQALKLRVVKPPCKTCARCLDFFIIGCESWRQSLTSPLPCIYSTPSPAAVPCTSYLPCRSLGYTVHHCQFTPGWAICLISHEKTAQNSTPFHRARSIFVCFVLVSPGVFVSPRRMRGAALSEREAGPRPAASPPDWFCSRVRLPGSRPLLIAILRLVLNREQTGASVIILVNTEFVLDLFS